MQFTDKNTILFTFFTILLTFLSCDSSKEPLPEGSTQELNLSGVALQEPITAIAAGNGAQITIRYVGGVSVVLIIPGRNVGGYDLGINGAQATYTENGQTFNAFSRTQSSEGGGTIVISASVNNRISGFFNFDVRVANGNLLRVRSGNFSAVEVR